MSTVAVVCEYNPFHNGHKYQIDKIREEFGDDPVFLFDDVLSELDETRRDYLIHKILGKQVIMTSCEQSFISGMDGAKTVRVINGEYFE